MKKILAYASQLYKIDIGDMTTSWKPVFGESSLYKSRYRIVLRCHIYLNRPLRIISSAMDFLQQSKRKNLVCKLKIQNDVLRENISSSVCELRNFLRSRKDTAYIRSIPSLSQPMKGKLFDKNFGKGNQTSGLVNNEVNAESQTSQTGIR